MTTCCVAVAHAEAPDLLRGRRSGDCPGVDLLVSEGWPACPTSYSTSQDNLQFIDNVASWIGCHGGIFADDLESGDTSRWSMTVP